ncbi:MAG TPA: hypothetical protein VMU84_07195, partial [Thermoanaerobaculia bacterium]|nr:hypothetical protein [Thermoanaerobaculia bacterium]
MFRAAGSSGDDRTGTMKSLLTACLLIAALPMGAQTIRNDDSCDISVAPAATLLLPYFQVQIDGGGAAPRDTLVTITNVSNAMRIVHVTLWTDLAYPIFAFDLTLTPYDVQPLSFYGLLVTGAVPGA